jgi:hypothetical protein
MKAHGDRKGKVRFLEEMGDLFEVRAAGRERVGQPGAVGKGAPIGARPVLYRSGGLEGEIPSGGDQPRALFWRLRERD